MEREIELQCAAALELVLTLMFKVGSVTAPIVPLLPGTRRALTAAESLKETQQLPRLPLANSANLNSLMTLLGSLQPSTLGVFPPDSLALISQLKKLIVRQGELNKPQKLKNSVNNSGLLLESRLANRQLLPANLNLESDLKALLFRLFSSLNYRQEFRLTQNAPKDLRTSYALARYEESGSEDREIRNKLRQETEAVLNSLIGRQKRTLEECQNRCPVWYFEIPVKTASGLTTLRLDIQRRDEADPQYSSEPEWSANFSIELENLERVDSQIVLKDNLVDLSLNTQSESARQELRNGKGELRHELEKYGLEMLSLVINSDS